MFFAGRLALAAWASRPGPPARALPGDGGPAIAGQAEVWNTLREVIDTELTRRQRQVLRAIVLEELPLDEAVRRLGSNRNAVYKLLHDLAALEANQQLPTEAELRQSLSDRRDEAPPGRSEPGG